MKIKSSPNSLKHYFNAYSFSNVSEADFNNEIERYKSLEKDQKTMDFISKFKIGQTVFICDINLSNTEFKVYEDKITNIDFKNKKYVFNPTGLTDWYVSEEHIFDTKQEAIKYGNLNIEHNFISYS